MLRMLGIAADGTKLVLLGLDDENVARLTGDQPIKVDCAELGLPGVIVTIVHGKTLDDIIARLETMGVRVPPDGGQTPRRSAS